MGEISWRGHPFHLAWCNQTPDCSLISGGSSAPPPPMTKYCRGTGIGSWDWKPHAEAPNLSPEPEELPSRASRGFCELRACRCRANMAHTRQSRPDYGLGFQVKVPKTFYVVPSSVAIGKGVVQQYHVTRTHNPNRTMPPPPARSNLKDSLETMRVLRYPAWLGERVRE